MLDRDSNRQQVDALRVKPQSSRDNLIITTTIGKIYKNISSNQQVNHKPYMCKICYLKGNSKRISYFYL